MKIYSDYIEKHIKTCSYIPQTIKLNTFNIIVIPAYNEPNIISTLNSISNCNIPHRKVEVIIVINSATNTPIKIIEQNKKTAIEIEDWANKKNNKNIAYHGILLENIPPKKAGAGYARKVGMDEAIQRFEKINNYNGIITSLDADSMVKSNYLIELENLFIKNSKTDACTIYFEHPLDGDKYDNVVYEKITEYELYLRYYSLSLKYTGFPYFYHTVGSSFAVRAYTYCKQGGMNTKKAGEDFYFLHKIMPLGNYKYLTSTSVYPSPRPSDRVPFGTGPIIKSMIDRPDKAFLTYNFSAFEDLKIFFCKIDQLYNIENFKYEFFNYPKPVNDFLEENDFKIALIEINSNTSSLKSFKKRFFRWFDAFRILKFLNFSHQSYFKKQLLTEALNDFLASSQIENIEITNKNKLLENIRKLEKLIK